MRRAAALVVAAALVLTGTALLPFAAAPPGVDKAAAATECTWKRQVKRVVRHVRRDGKLRRVVRRKPRWVCILRPAAPVVAPLPAPAPVPPPPPGPEPEPEANRLGVKAAEYFYVLSRPSVRAGEVTVELNNRGEDPHNLNLREEDGEGTPYELPETDSLQRNVISFELPAGNYRLWCSLPEHEERGMYTTLVVE